MFNLDEYKAIWLLDFEFIALNGNKPDPVCLVAIEFKSQQTLRVWQNDLRKLEAPPFDTGEDSLFIAYYASAEIGCFLELNWPIPINIIDLFAEFRIINNGRLGVSSGRSLLAALKFFNLNVPLESYKDDMRDLILSGGPWSKEQRVAILNYCESDVKALQDLLPMFTDRLNSHSLIRGRYLAAVARMEFNGVPIDRDSYEVLTTHWEAIKLKLIKQLDTYNLYEGTTFKQRNFAGLLRTKKYAWPKTERGNLSLSEDTFKSMCQVYPDLQVVHELRQSLSKLKLNDLQVGKDDRNRCLLSPFSSKTGRNQPSTTKFIYGPSSWVRSLIKPEKDTAIAYLDWSQQEFGIAAALSNDSRMLQAYESGDPYLEFAKLANAVPSNATKSSHPYERGLYKQCILATQYGMGTQSLALRINKTEPEAQELLNMHQRIFSIYWNWIDRAVDYAQLTGYISTVFGWTLHVNAATKIRTIQNFPMQANGAEMLRLACCMVTEAGVSVCAPVHDALLIESSIDSLGSDVELAQKSMREASKIILGGFELSTDVEVFKYPSRYLDERGQEMWNTIKEITGIN